MSTYANYICITYKLQHVYFIIGISNGMCPFIDINAILYYYQYTPRVYHFYFNTLHIVDEINIVYLGLMFSLMCLRLAVIVYILCFPCFSFLRLQCEVRNVRDCSFIVCSLFMKCNIWLLHVPFYLQYLFDIIIIVFLIGSE